MKKEYEQQKLDKIIAERVEARVNYRNDTMEDNNAVSRDQYFIV